ncbi:MAG: hypothetical protein JWN88_2406 [Frankiales bacterium]|jgi:hypothetical protein|nr:hypothetical protein [Frankiales bacterium]
MDVGGGREDLRRLAVWLSRRREVDEAVAQLTHYGPAASSRVHSHLQALTGLLALETAAFDALREGAPDVPQLPLPALVRDEHTVVSLAAGRERRARQRT